MLVLVLTTLDYFEKNPIEFDRFNKYEEESMF
jgi:hypothetical protein